MTIKFPVCFLIWPLLWVGLFSPIILTAQEAAGTAPSAIDETKVIHQEESSAEVSSTPKIAPMLATERLRNQQLSQLHQLTTSPSPIWIEVDTQKSLGFWQKDKSNQPQGALLMLHETGVNPRWSALLLKLHDYLPNYGWATLSIEVPALPTTVVPIRPPLKSSSAVEATSSAAGEPTNTNSSTTAIDETQVVHQEGAVSTSQSSSEIQTAPQPTLETVRTQTLQRIDAAIKYLHKKGRFNLAILGEGNSAYWARQFVAKNTQGETPDKITPFRALILLDLKSLPSSTDLSEHEDVSTPLVRVLDIYTLSNTTNKKSSQDRKLFARQKGYLVYDLRAITLAQAEVGANSDASVAKIIRAFLFKQAKGSEQLIPEASTPQ